MEVFGSSTPPRETPRWLPEATTTQVMLSSFTLLARFPNDAPQWQAAAWLGSIGVCAWLPVNLGRAWVGLACAVVLGFISQQALVYGAVALTLAWLAAAMRFDVRRGLLDPRYWALCAGWWVGQALLLELSGRDGIGRLNAAWATTLAWCLVAASFVAAVACFVSRRKTGTGSLLIGLTFVLGAGVPLVLAFVGVMIVLATSSSLNSGWQCNWQDGQCNYGPGK